MSKWLQWLLIILFFLLSVFSLVNIHEIGHLVFARLLGVSDATYSLFYHSNGIYAIGYLIADISKLTPTAQSAVYVGGIIFTQLVALTALIIRKIWVRQWFVKKLIALFAVVLISDFPLQVLQGVFADVKNQTMLKGVDLADFIFVISNEFELNTMLLKIVFVILLGSYLLLIWLNFWDRRPQKLSAHL